MGLANCVRGNKVVWGLDVNSLCRDNSLSCPLFADLTLHNYSRQPGPSTPLPLSVHPNRSRSPAPAPVQGRWLGPGSGSDGSGQGPRLSIWVNFNLKETMQFYYQGSRPLLSNKCPRDPEWWAAKDYIRFRIAGCIKIWSQATIERFPCY